MSYLDELNEVQQQAVTTTQGAVMIVAGPGSGKTRVLTYRIGHLLANGVDAFRILSLTFTNKAAAEMRHRVEQIAGNEALNLYLGTFHSVFARILRFEAHHIGYPTNFSIYDTDDSRHLLKSIIKEKGLPDTLYKPNVVHNRISSAKNSLITAADYEKDFGLMAEDELSGKPRMAEVYKEYSDRCFKAGAMDFDDLLLQMYRLLSNNPDVCYKYQNRFEYFMIDEFQDTNYAQYKIVKLLSELNKNICVVGDDAQSIYAFRGATIANILNFEKDFKDVKILKLEQNYRSTEHIVKAANEVITHNKNQINKKIWTENAGGEKIKVIKAISDNDEGRLVADKIFEEKMRNQKPNSDFAILYRTNAQSRSFEEALRRLNIPYLIYGGLSFYQRKEVKDLIAYLRLTVNHNDEEALKRIINYPTRGIGNSSIEKATVVAAEKNLSLWQVLENADQLLPANRGNNAISQFVTMIKSFSVQLEKQNAFDLTTAIAKQSGLLQDLYNDKSVEGLSRYENIQELLNGIKEFTEATQNISFDGEVRAENDKSLGTYLQDIALLTDADKKDMKADAVKLMTIHAAKGLEFYGVFVAGLEENLFPSGMMINDREGLEEERRLFYVAITRAKQKLYLSFANTRYKYGQLIYSSPSRFLEEIDKGSVELLFNPAPGFQTAAPANSGGQDQFSKTISRPRPAATGYVHTPSADFVADDFRKIITGMEVEHQRFGIGKVTHLEGSANDKMATIFFQNNVGEKKIMLKFAKLRIIKNHGFSDN